MNNRENRETPSEPAEDPLDGQGASGPENTEPEKVGGDVVIGLPMDEYEEMQNQLEAALSEAEENKDGWQRSQADYNNLRRRTEMEREQMRGDIVGQILNPFLDILDDLELAVQNRPQEDGDNAWGEGIELVYRKLLSKLESQGVHRMEVEGMDFDPNFHEAITHEMNPDFEGGQIIAVVKPGYRIGDRVLRPAQVRVAA